LQPTRIEIAQHLIIEAIDHGWFTGMRATARPLLREVRSLIGKLLTNSTEDT
jgi:hypothetical protein